MAPAPHKLLMSLTAFILAPYVFGTNATYYPTAIIESRETQLCTYQIYENNTRPITNASCFLSPDFAVALATDADEGIVFFSDIASGSLRQVQNGQETGQLLYGLGSVEGIAVDWLARNVFWTDFELNHICVSHYDGKNRTVLIDDDLQNPRGIALDPFEGLIFWGDLLGVSDTEGRLERSLMDGTRRTIILDQNLASPSGLVLNLLEKRLYFADRGTDRIESVSYDGRDRKVIYEMANAGFFDVTIHGSYLYATTWRPLEANGKVLVIGYRGNDTGRVIQTFDHSGRGLGIASLDEHSQPDDYQGACGYFNGGCHQLCLPISSTNRSCACATGYSLALDGMTCEANYTKDHFLLVVDSSLKTIFQVDATTQAHSISALPLEALDFPVAVAYDHVDSMVYWTDRARSAIGRAALDGSYEDAALIKNVTDSGGIALDTRRRIVYWTDEERNEISKVDMDGVLLPSVFVAQGLDEPRAIAVDLRNGDVYWTDWGAEAKIERVSLNGSNREVLVVGDLGWPNCLALDLENNVMYWCDAQRDRIETSDLDGKGRHTLVSFIEQTHPFGLVVLGEFIYWTDWLSHQLLRLNRWTDGQVERVGDPEFLRMQGLAVFEYPMTFEDASSGSDVSVVTEDRNLITEARPTSTPEPGALNVVLVAAAAGGGLVLILALIVTIGCAVTCLRSNGGRNKGPDDRVPMSVRSTSFVESYDPAGLPGPGQTNNNSTPPPLPPARKPGITDEHTYQDITEYRKYIQGHHGAPQEGYVNPEFREGDSGDDSERYVRRIGPEAETVPTETNAEERQAPATPAKPQPAAEAGLSPEDDTYLTPTVAQDDGYVDFRS